MGVHLSAFNISSQVSIIVATSILEEGLDVKSCNLVVRFDPSVTVCSFIQSRGRARMQGSEYLLLVRRWHLLRSFSEWVILCVTMLWLISNRDLITCACEKVLAVTSIFGLCIYIEIYERMNRLLGFRIVCWCSHGFKLIRLPSLFCGKAAETVDL